MAHPNAEPFLHCTGRSDRIILSSDPDEVARISDPSVLAVIASGGEVPAWLGEVERQVLSGTFTQPRVILPAATIAEIEASVKAELGVSGLSPEARKGLADNLVDLARRCRDLTKASRFRFRFFTDPPNCRCSYHVDVVPPDTPTTAILRVYCGARTQYLEPSSLTSWEDFYSYVFRREQLQKKLHKAQADKDAYQEQSAQASLDRMEIAPFFILPNARGPATIPPFALVACKFVDSRYLWKQAYVRTQAARGWIHRSPMTGEPRFVATVNAVG